MSQPLRPGRQVLCQDLGGEAVLLNLASGVYFSLNEVGARVWRLLAAGTAAEDIPARLAAEYDVSPEQASQDVARLLAELRVHGLLESDRPAGPGPAEP